MRYNKRWLVEGIPWMVILDARGNALANSSGKKGNIGFPENQQEVAHLVGMLEKTKERLSVQDLAVIRDSLTQAAHPRAR